MTTQAEYLNRPSALSTEGEDLLKSITFIRTWCHDIGNYLGMMRNLIDLVNDVKPEQLAEISGMLSTTCRMMEDIHENIKEYTRGATGINFQQVKISEIIMDLIQIYNGMASSHGVTLIADIQSEGIPLIMADRLKLNQTLSNLISNAIKFSRAGADVLIEVICGTELMISVKDFGIGIPTEKLVDVFKPYTRLNKDYPGTGLGLANCKRFMDEMGGKLTVISKSGEGSTFTVTIPVV
ncbi:HAMP domain-containing sensor histidine kinase [Chitinophaga sp. sic0106]|uniref:sensor histidine kinase n=1 Tax=Chitinophaga sp. sic0106 TaxID=2854785 RepID=UPI001C4580AD|nr:HAMP domain-containing sensor histidine kinase [Chitinophaga sp. sic0106]MBV7529055.1 HAMP domain-containing histidine kinase [Chitinophaga sp. sic0106]